MAGPARTWTLALALALTGCDGVFGLREVTPPDALVASGFDEDQDTVDNVFDHCPGIVSAVEQDTQDADGDGVGDPCDPHPDTPGDRILLASFFDDPATDPSTWTPIGPWTFEAGSVALDNATMTSSLLAMSTFPLASSLTVELGYRALRYGGAGNQARISLDGGVHGCYIEEDVPSDSSSQLFLVTAGTSLALGSLSPPIEPLVLTRIAMTRDAAAGAATLRCRVGGVMIEGASTDMRGEVRITSGAQPMRVEYVVVYGVM